MKKIFYSIIMMIACVAFTASCSKSSDDGGGSNGGDNDTGNDNVPTAHGIYACLNPTDPTFITMSDAEGQQAVISGTKTSTGLPDKVQQILVKTKDETEYCQIYFNENEQYEQVIAPNGVQMLFEWVSKTKAALTLVDPNTNEQLNTVIDFESPSSASAEGRNAITRSGKTSMTLEPTRDMDYVPTMQVTRGTQRAGGVTGDIYVEECDYPANSKEVLVAVYSWTEVNGYSSVGEWRCNLLCTPVGKGHYQFTIPSSEWKHTNFSGFAERICGIINNICYVNGFTYPSSGLKETICVAIASAATTLGLGISAPVVAGFTKACLSMAASLDALCAIVNANYDFGVPPEMGKEVSTVADKMVEILKEEEFKWNRIYAVPFVNAIPKCIYGNPQVLIDGQQFKSSTITLGSSPTIAAFALNPPAPSHGVGYTATAVMGCLPAGSKVVMSIVGTDGYEDQETSTVPDDATQSYVAKLHVPGASTGVKDVCTVSVTLPNGSTLVKEAWLVFQ